MMPEAPLIVVSILSLIGVIWYGEDDDLFGVALFAIICVASLYLMFSTYNHAYKKGQVDAINGDFKYEMKVTPDTTYVETNH